MRKRFIGYDQTTETEMEKVIGEAVSVDSRQ